MAVQPTDVRPRLLPIVIVASLASFVKENLSSYGEHYQTINGPNKPVSGAASHEMMAMSHGPLEAVSSSHVQYTPYGIPWCPFSCLALFCSA